MHIQRPLGKETKDAQNTVDPNAVEDENNSVKNKLLRKIQRPPGELQYRI